MKERPLHLRTILSAATLLVALLAIGIAVSFVVFATLTHDSEARLADSAESVNLGMQVEIDLHRLARTDAPAERAQIATDLGQAVDKLRDYVNTKAEAADLDALQRNVKALLRAESVRGGPTPSLEPVLASVERFVQLNRGQAEAERANAAQMDKIADRIALALGVATVGLVGWLLFWMNTRAFRPVLSLAEAMERFGRGDRAARAPEAGPAELRDMAWRFNQMAASLAAEREAQLAFLAGVAHDLRNPLGALQIAMSPMRPGKPLPPEARIRQTFERVGRHIARLDRMIGDLLDTTAIESGNLELKLEQRDVRELVREVADLFDGVSGEHVLEIQAPDQPVEIPCDPLRIVQVLTNLVSNAIKYSPGSAKIELRVSSSDGDAVISVCDHGIGFSDQERTRMFEPFARGARAKHVTPGVGLGLFVVRRIVEAHGGTVEIESRLGEGSTFHVRIPLARESKTTASPVAYDCSFN